MINDKIKALFSFIEFLHSNIENFKQFDNVINEIDLLYEEKNKLNPRSNFDDKLKYDEVQPKFKDKFNVINENIIQGIRAKAFELDICDLNNKRDFWNWNSSGIDNLKENFSKDDLPEILFHESEYIEFRTKTNCIYFQSLFFSDLDRILKELFGFFDKNTENKFEAFEPKPIHKDFQPQQEIQYACNLSRNSILEIKKEIFDKVPKNFTEESDEIWLNRFIIDNTISKTNVFGNTKGKKNFTTANEYLTALVEIISENLINKGLTALKRDRFINDKFKIANISSRKDQITNRKNEYESTKAKLKNMFSETT
jgi:hypothetical protein